MRTAEGTTLDYSSAEQTHVRGDTLTETVTRVLVFTHICPQLHTFPPIYWSTSLHTDVSAHKTLKNTIRVSSLRLMSNARFISAVRGRALVKRVRKELNRSARLNVFKKRHQPHFMTWPTCRVQTSLLRASH